ncbi:MAG: DsbA family protein [Rhodospirillaceae bacterium]|nr:DsbA family protein [Rhodospirillaceae bacterium]
MVRVLILAVFGVLFAVSTLPVLTSRAAEAPAGKGAGKAAAVKADPTPGPPLVAANPEAGAVLVALIDYEDTGTQLLRDKLAAFAKANKDIKLQIKPWAASGGPLAHLSARAAYAAERQGKFAAFHAAMLSETGSHTYLSIRDLSNLIGLNWEKLAADIDDPKTGEAVEANAKLAESLKLATGPAFVAGTKVFNDPWNKVDFAAMAAAARAAK